MPPRSTAGQRVYVHLGVPKTGTSFLQQTLEDNGPALRAAGLLYPGGTTKMFHAALEVTDESESWGRPEELTRGSWAKICGQARAHPGTTVISNELLCGASREQVAEALGHLDGLEVHVVLTARDLGRQIPAEWQEGIKHGRTVRFAEFRQRILDPGRAHPHGRRFWQYQDVPDVLARWGDELPADRVHLITCPPSGTGPRVLWERFCAVLGVDPDLAELPESPVNTSLGITEIEVLRRVNESFRRADDPQAYGRLVKRLFANEVLRRHSSPRNALPPELLPRVRELTAAWRGLVEERGYDVTGDLDELEPLEPMVGPDPVVDPDQVTAEEALAVSTAAIADLLQEVGRLRRTNAVLRRTVPEARSVLRHVARKVVRRLNR